MMKKLEIVTNLAVMIVTVVLLAISCKDQMIDTGKVGESVGQIEIQKRIDASLLKALVMRSEDPEAALKAAQAALSDSERNGYNHGQVMAHVRLSQLLLNKDRSNALAHVQQAENLLKNTSDQAGKINAVIAKAALASGREKNELEQSVRLYTDALLMCDPVGRYPSELAQIYVELARNLRATGDREKSNFFLSQGYRHLQNDYDRAIYHNQMALNAAWAGDYSGAQAEYELAAGLYEKLELWRRRAVVIYNIGLLCRDRHEYERALSYMDYAVKALQMAEDIDLFVKVQLARAETLEAVDNRAEADNAYRMCIVRIPHVHSAAILADLYHALADFSFRKGRFREAYDYLCSYIRNREKIVDETRSAALARAQEELDTRIKEMEIVILRKQNEIQLIVFSGLLILAGIVLFFLIRRFIHLYAFWKRQKFIGQYRILERLGGGGMGLVYKAHSLKDKKKLVAIKVLKDELMCDEENRRRFRREGEVIDRLDHANIVRVIERGQENGRYYLALEYLDGVTLEQIIGQEDSPALADKLRLMIQISSALSAIHQAGIIHRDIKPSNIMLVKDDAGQTQAKLLDFGLAHLWYHSRLTQTGMVLGTLSYQAPEQFERLKSGPEADVYALGLVFYELLTNKPLRHDESLSAMSKRIVNGQMLPLDSEQAGLSDELLDVLRRMTDKFAANRPDCRSVHQRLSAYLAAIDY